MVLDKTDQQILNQLQTSFPVTLYPFNKLADTLKLPLNELLKRITKLKKNHFIKYLGPIINTSSLGFKSALIALEVHQSRIKKTVPIINAYPGVSHNYLRNHQYNIWFTLAVPPQMELQKVMYTLLKRTGIKNYLYLPSIKTYKIGLILNANCHSKNLPGSKQKNSQNTNHQPFKINDLEQNILKNSQYGIPIRQDPYQKIIHKYKLEKNDFLNIIQSLLKRRIIRRFGAIVNHRNIGYKYNTMVIWKIKQDFVDQFAAKLHFHPTITHLYQRKIYPHWPFSLYSMIHGNSDTELKASINKIVEENQDLIENHQLLESLNEYKKVRLLYFDNTYDKWHKKYIKQ
jgi:siroheme decarboxylase